jgi:crotonobetainyl-CoA:carnitine CoA-transferase CaiB-like acyl-CoA transferase
MASPGRPLAGIRAIDLSVFVQGPIAATLLADLGADVIKVEPAGRGDPARGLLRAFGVDVTDADGDSLFWTVSNRGKRDLALDLRNPAARPVFERLLRDADVFVTNLLPGALAELGADEAAVRAVNPAIVYARGAGLGEVGPLADDPCVDTVGMGYGGFMFTASPSPDEPYYPPGAMADMLSGTFLAFGVLAALRERERTGEGQTVSASQLHALMWMQGLNVAAAANLGYAFPPQDRRLAPVPSFNTYACADGRWLALAMVFDAQWPPLCRALGLADLAGRPEYATAAGRAADAPAIVRAFEARFATRPAAEWLADLRAAGLWVTAVNRVEDLPADPQVAANGYLATLDSGLQAVRMPFTLGGHAPPTAPAPAYGADSDAVLAECGFTPEEVAGLRASGAVW